MWQRLGKFVIKARLPLLLALLAATIVMGYYASKVKLSYEFARAIPTDNPKYQEYQSFRKLFGDDGNVLVIGVQTNNFFKLETFRSYQQMLGEVRQVKGVEDILSVPGAVSLDKDSVLQKLTAKRIFRETIPSQASLDSAAISFKNLPFYRSLLYNPGTQAYLMGVKINKDTLNSPARARVVDEIMAATSRFEKTSSVQVHLSGLPLIRTVVAGRIQHEMKLFLAGSLLLSVLILFLFFRSLSTTLISLAVVVVGVIWTVGTIQLCGYKITLLTALIPSLVVVIGIPNCIYFINKYHTSYIKSQDPLPQSRKINALVDMVSKMGVVTLFCNITAAIGFAVFALTRSAILKEFGVVSGISIMIIFVVSFILLPAVLSYLPAPGKRQLKYLDNKWIGIFLDKVEQWVFGHRKMVLAFTGILVLASLAGMWKLKSVAFIVDDLPKTDKIYTDLKFFEHHFKGVMPLEILIDTKKKNGLAGTRALTVFEKVDSLATYITGRSEMNRPLCISEGLKFAKQGFFDNDSLQYSMPNAFDGAFLTDYLKPGKDSSGNNNFTKMMRSFMDSNREFTRLSVSMADIGTEKLPAVLADIQGKADQYFDSSLYKVSLTGTSITFLEGSRFIISGLKESIFWAFLLIALCMLYLFRSFKILICSLVPNLIPLLVTAGVMGWAGVPLKPSTVLIFSVALGIAVDITIRFLVNYRQDLPQSGFDVPATVRNTVQQTGLSIIYTSLVLTAGFVIFCASSFGGTFALGWLTSVTLLVATITNLVLLPVLLLVFNPQKRKS
jgi:predicted RND superfamily exporter protein